MTGNDPRETSGVETVNPVIVRSKRVTPLLFALVTFVCLSCCHLADAADYDPLHIKAGFQPKTIDLTVDDAKRDREIPIRVYLPEFNNAAPVVLFSHGLGGNRQGSSYLGKHWAARGYVAVFLQHPGSDDSVWKGLRLRDLKTAMQKAASAENYLLRGQDVPAVLDQLEKWDAESTNELKGRLNLKQVGMSGHSFGAQTTQAVSGQSLPIGNASLTDARIKAALPQSPSSPRRGDLQAAFRQVKIPWLLMTGTKDTSPIGVQTVATRLAVFPALPAGDKYQLVLHNGEHLAFTDHKLPRFKKQRNPNHHRVILALSTAFWDTYLRNDNAAKAWLQGAGPRTILESEDKWERK